MVDTSDLLGRLKKEVRVEVIDDLIRSLTQMKAETLVPEGKPLTGLNILEAAETVLKERGPMTTPEIAQTLMARGVKSNSKNFVATVYASLKAAKDRFKREGGTWVTAKKK